MKTALRAAEQGNGTTSRPVQYRFTMNDLGNPEKTLPACVIIGGGIGGVLTALKLAEAGKQVILIERNAELLSGTSNSTPGRMGCGFHYGDIDTAIFLLRITVNFMRKFKLFTLADSMPDKSFLKYGLYFLHKDTLPDQQKKVRATYVALDEEYKRLASVDPENKVLGEPKNFMKYLTYNLEQYNQHIRNASATVVDGVKTPEKLLDWKKFRTHLLTLIKNHPNILLLNKFEVVDEISLSFDPTFRFQYKVTVTDLNKSRPGKEVRREILTRTVVNSTWENLEEVSAKAGILPDKVRTNRLKALVKVKLPPELAECPSTFFCLGPYCMFSNLGDGTALMTYAPVTNIAVSTSLKTPPDIQKFLKYTAPREEINHIGNGIIKGVATYIRGMEEAELLEVRFGIVRTLGETLMGTLHTPEDPIHSRAYTEVSAPHPGFIQNASTKLMYGIENADLVLQKIEDAEQKYKDIFFMVSVTVYQLFNKRIENFTKHYEDSLDPDNCNVRQHMTILTYAQTLAFYYATRYDLEEIKASTSPEMQRRRLQQREEREQKLKSKSGGSFFRSSSTGHTPDGLKDDSATTSDTSSFEDPNSSSGSNHSGLSLTEVAGIPIPPSSHPAASSPGSSTDSTPPNVDSLDERRELHAKGKELFLTILAIDIARSSQIYNTIVQHIIKLSGDASEPKEGVVEKTSNLVYSLYRKRNKSSSEVSTSASEFEASLIAREMERDKRLNKGWKEDCCRQFIQNIIKNSGNTSEPEEGIVAKTSDIVYSLYGKRNKRSSEVSTPSDLADKFQNSLATCEKERNRRLNTWWKDDYRRQNAGTSYDEKTDVCNGDLTPLRRR